MLTKICRFLIKKKYIYIYIYIYIDKENISIKAREAQLAERGPEAI